jgi:hypothetical protein
MNFEQKYIKYKNKYLTLKKILGGEDKEKYPTLTPIFETTKSEKIEPTPTPTPTTPPTPTVEIPSHGKIEWNINPNEPRNTRNNTSVKLTKKNGETFIVREGDYINYVSKSGFNPPATGELIPLDPNNPYAQLPRQVGRQLGYVRSFLDENGTHTGPPVAIEVYRQNYDSLIFEKQPTHKTSRFDQVKLYKRNNDWPAGSGP